MEVSSCHLEAVGIWHLLMCLYTNCMACTGPKMSERGNACLSLAYTYVRTPPAPQNNIQLHDVQKTV